MIASALFFIAWSIISTKQNIDSFEKGGRFIFYILGCSNLGFALGDFLSRIHVT